MKRYLYFLWIFTACGLSACGEEEADDGLSEAQGELVSYGLGRQGRGVQGLGRMGTQEEFTGLGRLSSVEGLNSFGGGLNPRGRGERGGLGGMRDEVGGLGAENDNGGEITENNNIERICGLLCDKITTCGFQDPDCEIGCVSVLDFEEDQDLIECGLSASCSGLDVCFEKFNESRVSDDVVVESEPADQCFHACDRIEGCFGLRPDCVRQCQSDIDGTRMSACVIESSCEQIPECF